MSGVCQCNTGELVCGGLCIDAQNDSKHCGACGTVCSGKVCEAGKCGMPAVLALATHSRGAHACAILSNRTLKCWGGNASGEIGIGKIGDLSKPPAAPVVLGVGRTVKQVALGANHTCAILDNGTVKCWGYNKYGQLGYGDKQDRTKPDNKTVSLGVGRTAKELTGGYGHTCVILDNGAVKCWGRNGFGQLGYGDNQSRSKPETAVIALGPGRTAKQISGGDSGTCALLDNYTVKCWGRNTTGQLGYGDTKHRNKPDTRAIDLGPGRTAKQIAVGFEYVCAILDNGTVKCWGDGGNKLGYGDSISRLKPDSSPIDLGVGRTAKQISAGFFHVCVLLDNDTVKCWGTNGYGQLGYRHNQSLLKPPQYPVRFPPGRTVKQIAVGDGFTCALLDNGAVKCWGSNIFSQLGLGISSKSVGYPSGNLKF